MSPKALHRFEEFTRFADFGTFDNRQAVGFKRHLEARRSDHTGEPLRRATVHSTLTALQEFLRWLAPQHGYRSKIEVADNQMFTPHTFRSTLVRLCRGPEQFKAWSQNLGHSDPLTTFGSYGRLDLETQGDLVRTAGASRDASDKIERLGAILDAWGRTPEAGSQPPISTTLVPRRYHEASRPICGPYVDRRK